MATKSSKKQKPRKTPKPARQKLTAVHKAIERNIAKAEQRHRKAVQQQAAAKPSPKPGGRLGILNAALQVLKAAKQPMRCKEMVEQALAKRLWATNGKTPEATLNAAIIREIAAKGQASRFKKVDRGLFAATAKA